MNLLRRFSLAASLTLALCGLSAPVFAGKPNIMESCKVCHKEAPEQTIRGKIMSVSEAFKSFNVNVGPVVWIVKYDDNLKIKEGQKFSGPEALKSIKKDHEILVSYTGAEAKAMATQVAVKQPYKVPAEQQFSLDELKNLVAQGPEKGAYTLIDSRPPTMYAEGHIPGAKSLPYAKFAELAPKVLPSDKTSLLIFYCAGETCTLSPFSAREAGKLGYTNLRVFQAGLPAWKKSKGLLISETASLETMIKENTSYVLIDLREQQIAEAGFIKDAVSIPAQKLSEAKDRFPAVKTAPIILVDSAQASDEAFNTVSGWGYTNTSVLRDGMAAWKGELVKGQLVTRIEYVKRLKAGEIGVEEFKSIATKKPGNAVILDVREGGTEGVMAGAIAIPRNELANRLGELPKDKEIVIHCNTGILAKMSYDTLKENGFSNVRYFNAIIQVAKDGTFEINEK